MENISFELFWSIICKYFGYNVEKYLLWSFPIGIYLEIILTIDYNFCYENCLVLYLFFTQLSFVKFISMQICNCVVL